MTAKRALDLDDALYDYVLAHSLREHPVQRALRQAADALPHAGMQIGPDQAQFMAFLVRSIGARRAIEIGVFRGYSALSVALALPDDGVLGPARDTLDARIAAGDAGTFDFAFIDADKTSYDDYYERCLVLLREGGVIAVDNVLWSGDVARPAKSADTAALQAFNDKLHDDRRVDLSLLPIGDGLTLARKR